MLFSLDCFYHGFWIVHLAGEILLLEKYIAGKEVLAGSPSQVCSGHFGSHFEDPARRSSA
jgi:hypothetical protein